MDGKDSDGKRRCVSMDTRLFNYLILSLSGQPTTARKWIRAKMLAMSRVTSQKVKEEVYLQIAEPALAAKYRRIRAIETGLIKAMGTK